MDQDQQQPNPQSQNPNADIYPNPNNPQSQVELKPKKKRSCLKIFGIIFLILIILLGGAYGYFRYRIKTAKDINSVNDSDLQLSKISIPDEENSFFELIKIKDVVVYPEQKEELEKIAAIIEGQAWDETFAKDLLAKNEKALEYFNQFDQKPKFIDPVMSDPEKFNYNSIVLSGASTASRNIAKIQAIKVMLLIKEGKSEEAFEENLKIFRLNYKLINYQPSLIQYLLGIAVANIGWEQLDLIITSNSLSSEFLQKNKEYITKFQSTSSGFKTALKSEYIIFSKNITEQIAAKPEDLKTAIEGVNLPLEKMPTNYYFQPNRTKQEFAGWIREQIKLADSQCSNLKSSASYSVSRSKYKLFLTENAIGKLLVELPVSAMANLQEKRCKTENLADQVLQKIK